MTHWWRAYDEALHDPKLIGLPDKLFRAWFNLLCVASKNGGVLPVMSLVAIELRVSIHKAAEWVTALVVAGLIDEIETGKFAPHNWGGRQFQSDGSTQRVKRFRERKRNVSSAVSETPTDTDTDTDTDSGGGEDARAREPLLSPRAIQFADELACIAGHDPQFVPPSWCGAAMHVQKWLTVWPEDVIRETVRAVAGKKRDGPAGTITYFEQAIARAFAALQTPLPVVKVVEKEPEAIHVRSERQPSHVQAVAQRIAAGLAALEADDERHRAASAASEVQRIGRG